MAAAQRALLIQPLRDLIEAARQQRAALPQSSSDRRFYLGVEAAAEEFIHPEIAASRPREWPDREQAPFRNGYLATVAIIGAAVTAEHPPGRLPLPAPTQPVRR